LDLASAVADESGVPLQSVTYEFFAQSKTLSPAAGHVFTQTVLHRFFGLGLVK